MEIPQSTTLKRVNVYKEQLCYYVGPSNEVNEEGSSCGISTNCEEGRIKLEVKRVCHMKLTLNPRLPCIQNNELNYHGYSLHSTFIECII